jgi:hypothetical protein
LLKGRVRELHLALDTRGPQDAKLPPGLDRVLQQCRFAGTRLSIHDQDSTVPAARGLQEPLEHLALALPAEQLLSRHACERPGL